MNYAAIKTCDIANGPGVRTSLFVSGCTHHCKGCFQPETWDFSYGEPFTQDVIDTILHSLEPAYVAGLTLLGGEPFEPANQPAVAELLRQLPGALPRQKCVGLYGLPARPGPAARPGRRCGPCAADARLHRRAGGRPVRAGEKGPCSAVPRLVQPAAHRHSGDAGIRAGIVLWDDGYQRGGHYDAKGTR